MNEDRMSANIAHLQLAEVVEKRMAAQEGLGFARPSARQQSAKKGCIARLAQWLKTNRNRF